MERLPPPSAFQFRRTRPLRLAVYREGRLALRERILEVGAGEGAVAAEMAARTETVVTALDREGPLSRPPRVRFVRGDAEAPPFADRSFDAVAFHFVLMWVSRPVQALAEARRILAPEGVLLLLSEPDLTAREDEPETGLGRALLRAVEERGGRPDAGARMEGWLREAGFRPFLRRTPPVWVSLDDPREAETEVLALRKAGFLSRKEAEGILQAEREAAAAGTRRVRLPITYGVSRLR